MTERDRGIYSVYNMNIYIYIYLTIYLTIYIHIYIYIDSLKIGDFINLRSVLRDGYLSAAGILADYIYIQTELGLFDECIFMVELQRQYSASSELERYLSTFVVNPEDEQDDSTEKYIKALEVWYTNFNTNSNCIYGTK